MPPLFPPIVVPVTRNATANAVPPRIVGVPRVVAPLGLFARQRRGHYGVFAYPLRPLPLVLKPFPVLPNAPIQ